MTKEEIEAKRAEAMAKGRSTPAATSSRGAPGPGIPNQSRLTLARAGIRPEMKGRVMLSGPAGAGKTYTALVLATVLVGPTGRILVIDSEKESSLTYADVFAFDQLPWNPPYDPTALSLTLKEAAATYDCIIVDSFSHFWRKQGGVLDIAGDNVRGWKAARPIQENLIETLLDVDAHVIVCCRSKMDHLLEDKGGGKIAVTKIGLKAQQDDDLEYEVNVALEIDIQHVLHVVKSRTNAVPVGAQFLAGLGGDFAQQYREWLKSGEPVAPKAATDALRTALNGISDLGEQSKAKMAFLDAFGRPEFLLVSRLAEAQAWVQDAVAGRLPVERAEDDEPPEPSGDDGPGAPGAPSGPQAQPAPAAAQSATEAPAAANSPPSPATTGQIGQSATVDNGNPNALVDNATDEFEVGDSDPGAPPIDQAVEAGAVQMEQDLDGETFALVTGEGPTVFNGDTGHCRACGAPIWRDGDEATGQWLHCDPDLDDDPCAGPISPAAPDTDVDVLYAATHPVSKAAAIVAAEATVALIEAEVGALSHAAVVRELGVVGLPARGKPAELRARLFAWRIEVAAKTEAPAAT